jgi:hypothetical protein
MAYSDTKVDIREFAKRMVEETQNSGTSNKAILWVVIGASAFMSFLCIFIAVYALFTGMYAKEKANVLEEQIRYIQGSKR